MALTPMRSADAFLNDLYKELALDPEAIEKLKADPERIRTLARDAITRVDSEAQRVIERSSATLDAGVYHTVVRALGASLVLSVVSIAGIAAYTLHLSGNVSDVRMHIPDGLVALASAAVGALAGLITPVGHARK